MTKFIRYTIDGQEGWAELLEQDRLLVREGPEVTRLEEVELLPPVNPTKKSSASGATTPPTRRSWKTTCPKSP